MDGEFELERPASLGEAIEALARPGALALAGGTVALIGLRDRSLRPARVVSLDRLDGLRYIRADGGQIRIGARTTVSDLMAAPEIAATAPALAGATRVFAGLMVRNAATIGGNIACNSPAADLVPALLTLNAAVTLEGPEGRRQMPLAAFHTGYGTDSRLPGEIITEISWPQPPEAARQLFYKLARRAGDAITVTGVAVLLASEGGRCSRARIALGSVAPTVFRAEAAEACLQGARLTAGTISEAARLAREAARPIDDIRASAQYRRDMVEVLVRRLLTQAARG